MFITFAHENVIFELCPVYTMKQTWSKDKANVFKIHMWDVCSKVCFMSASLCKQGISWQNLLLACITSTASAKDNLD